MCVVGREGVEGSGCYRDTCSNGRECQTCLLSPELKVSRDLSCVWGTCTIVEAAVMCICVCVW